jgi:hypothetical protein
MYRVLIPVVFLITAAALTAQAPDRVTASSTLTAGSDGRTYFADHLFDGSWQYWCEGSASDGTGESFVLHYNRDITISSLTVRNGAGDLSRYFEKSRVLALEITNESGQQRIVELDDTPRLREYSVVPLRGRTFTVIILDIYPGSRGHDACLAEIGVNTPPARYTDYKNDEMTQRLFSAYFSRTDPEITNSRVRISGRQEDRDALLLTDVSTGQFIMLEIRYPKRNGRITHSETRFSLWSDGQWRSLPRSVWYHMFFWEDPASVLSGWLDDKELLILRQYLVSSEDPPTFYLGGEISDNTVTFFLSAPDSGGNGGALEFYESLQGRLSPPVEFRWDGIRFQPE